MLTGLFTGKCSPEVSGVGRLQIPLSREGRIMEKVLVPLAGIALVGFIIMRITDLWRCPGNPAHQLFPPVPAVWH